MTVQTAIRQHDTDILNFSARGLPPGVTIDPSTGQITGTVDTSTAGDYVVTITISDGSKTTDVSFVWNVGLADRPTDD